MCHVFQAVGLSHMLYSHHTQITALLAYSMCGDRMTDNV